MIYMPDNENIIFISAITDKTMQQSLDCQIGDSYSVDCSSYSIIRENKISNIFSISKDCITACQCIGPFSILIEGYVKPEPNPDVLPLLEHAALKSTGFKVTINNSEFQDMCVSSYNYTVNKKNNSCFLKLKLVRVII